MVNHRNGIEETLAKMMIHKLGDIATIDVAYFLGITAKDFAILINVRK